jgi:putative porin
MNLVNFSAYFFFVMSTSVAAEVVVDKKAQTHSDEVAIKSENPVVTLSSMDVINILVKEGVISQQRAKELVQSVAAEKISEEIKADKKTSEETLLDTKVVRVQYVPDYISKQIRDEVRLGLREEVVGDVLGQARHERWGVPGAMPSWVNRIKFSGDFKLRYQGDVFAEENAQPENIYINAQAVNDARMFSADPSFFHNITENRNRLRARIRLAMDAKITQGVKVGMRVTSGNLNDPVSTNQTLGNSLQPYQLVLDRAFIKLESEVKEHTFIGGRMPNPWVSTDLIWDKDLNFDGLVYKYRPLQSDDMYDDDRVFDTFISFGAFPLDEVELSTNDKWLLGFQTGVNWEFNNQNKLNIALAYYDYTNIAGERNTPDSNLLDYTAPDLLATGNTLFDISNNISDPEDIYLGLAADYTLVDVIVKYKVAQFAPVNVNVTLDYVENIGYKQSDVLQRAGGAAGLLPIYGNNDGKAKTTGYQLKFDIGWPTLKKRGNWQTSIAFKYLERDAVVDIYTDSDFRGGGTDVQGYILQGRYAFDDSTWMSLKLISADEIDGAPYGRDTVQLDLMASF